MDRALIHFKILNQFNSFDLGYYTENNAKNELIKPISFVAFLNLKTFFNSFQLIIF